MPAGAAQRIQGDVPLIDACAAATKIENTETLLVSGFGSVGYPKDIPLALADSNRDLSLTVVSGGSVGEEIDVALVEADAIDRRYPYQSRSAIRSAINEGQIAFEDRHISSLGDDVQYGNLVEPDIALVEAVAVGEDWLIPTTSIGQTPVYVECADRLIVEVNRAQPRSLESFHDVYNRRTPPNRTPIPLLEPGDRIGTKAITFNPEKLVAVVETDRRDEPYEFRDPTDEDKLIASNLCEFLESEVNRSPLFEDSIRLQFGVGSLGNALMSALSNADFGNRDLIYFGEVIQDGLLDLIDNGLLRSASATSLALSVDGQDRLFADIDRYAEDITLRPADISNNPALIDRFGVVSVNSALEVDLYGHVNSTHLDGTRIVNGVGGSGDFTRNSPLAIIALPSTAAGDGISRIVPMVPHVDHTEHDLDAVVTEQGVADLRGLSGHERAAALIESCSHPSFREDLCEYLDRASDGGGNLSHHLDTVFSWSE